MSLRNLPSGYTVALDLEELPSYAEAAERVARMGGVRLMSGRELAAAVLAGGEVVAALWVEASADTFTFDIAVAQAHQHRGLGLALARFGQSLAADYREAGFELELLAISPGGEALAAKLGLAQAGQAPGVTIWRHRLAA